MDTRFTDALESSEVPISTSSIVELDITLEVGCRVVVEITLDGMVDKDETIGFKLADAEEIAAIEEPCIEELVISTAGPLVIEMEGDTANVGPTASDGAATVFVEAPREGTEVDAPREDIEDVMELVVPGSRMLDPLLESTPASEIEELIDRGLPKVNDESTLDTEDKIALRPVELDPPVVDITSAEDIEAMLDTNAFKFDVML